MGRSIVADSVLKEAQIRYKTDLSQSANGAGVIDALNGAAIGSVIPVIGTLTGAIVGLTANQLEDRKA